VPTSPWRMRRSARWPTRSGQGGSSGVSPTAIVSCCCLSSVSLLPGETVRFCRSSRRWTAARRGGRRPVCDLARSRADRNQLGLVLQRGQRLPRGFMASFLVRPSRFRPRRRRSRPHR
jgi:hypothetical protein